MSVNGLRTCQQSARDKEKKKRAYPSNFRAIVYTMYTYKVISRPTGRSYLQKMKQSATLPHAQVRKEHDPVTHHKAVAAKHIVLPTYIGSRSTLNGNPSTRESIRMPK